MLAFSKKALLKETLIMIVVAPIVYAAHKIGKLFEPRNAVTLMFGIWLVFTLVIMGMDIHKQIKGEPTFNDFLRAEQEATMRNNNRTIEP